MEAVLNFTFVEATWTKNGLLGKVVGAADPALKKAQRTRPQCVYIDANKPAGPGSIVLVTANFPVGEGTMRRYTEDFQQYATLHRNFQRDGIHRQLDGAFYSEQGRNCRAKGSSRKDPKEYEGRRFPREQKNAQVVREKEWKQQQAMFRKRAEQAVEPFFPLVRWALGGTIGWSEKGQKGIPKIGADVVGTNGMVTGAFAVRIHRDADGEFGETTGGGFTACANIPPKQPCESYFFLPAYRLKIPLDQANRWMFFGGEVDHGTTKSVHLDMLQKELGTWGGTQYQPQLLAKLQRTREVVNWTWGQYSRAPQHSIVLRAQRYVRDHDSGWVFQRSQRSIQNWIQSGQTMRDARALARNWR